MAEASSLVLGRIPTALANTYQIRVVSQTDLAVFLSAPARMPSAIFVVPGNGSPNPEAPAWERRAISVHVFARLTRDAAGNLANDSAESAMRGIIDNVKDYRTGSGNSAVNMSIGGIQEADTIGDKEIYSHHRVTVLVDHRP